TYDAGKNEWKDMRPAQSPPPRHHAGMCFDEASGRTILHGGVVYPRDVIRNIPHAFWPDAGGVAFNDTWAYDGVKNEWRQLRPAQSPLAIHSARDLLAHDPDRRMLVLYDVSSGVWAFRSGGPGGAASSKRPAVPLPRLSAKEPPRARGRDARTRAWQEKIAKLADNTWMESDVQAPVFRCQSLTYDPVNRCVPQPGGCGWTPLPHPHAHRL